VANRRVKDKFHEDSDYRLRSIRRAQDFDAKYDNDKCYVPNITIDSMPSLIEALKTDKAIVEADVLHYNKESGYVIRKNLDTKQFLESIEKPMPKVRFREGADWFSFADDYDSPDFVGADFVPLLGGPLFKNLWYLDYVKQANQAFYAYNNDPVARRLIQCMKTFTLGRGFRVDCKHPTLSKIAMAVWEMFTETNDFTNQVEQMSIELSLNGEVMWYWLPKTHTKMTYNLNRDEIPRGLLPRARLIDPTTIWEIVTYPEDITRVLHYVQIFPTQMQIYTNSKVPATKYIYQHILADDITHYKVNSVSNEKRGRSDLYPVLGYLKRLRDAVNYTMLKDLKQSAWAIDTTIEGADEDISKYISSQAEAPTIPPPGSEYVHNARIKREMLEAKGTGVGSSQAFEWALSMIAIGYGIPVNYFGTHLSNQATRAGSVVATEPVTKVFESRQLDYERIFLRLSRKLFDLFGLPSDVKLEFSFPELITSDRSAKFKDLALAQSEGWISKERAAELAAKELGVTDFNYEKEKINIAEEPPAPVPGLPPIPDQAMKAPATSLPGTERKAAKDSSYAVS